MRRRGLQFVLAMGLALAAPSAAQANWTLISGSGGLNVSAAKPENPTIALVGGVPYASWYENAGPGPGLIYVKRYDGTAWSAPAPGPLNLDATHSASHPSVAGIAGVPYVTWDESTGAVDEIRVKRFNGTSWVEPAPGPLNVDPTHNATVASVADVAGVPYVAWNESTGATDEIRVKRFNGTSWVEPVAGALNVTAAGSFSPAPAITSVGGVPYVVWSETTGSIRVKRLVGGAWVEPAAGPLNVDATHAGSDPSITDVGGVPYVSWEEAGAGQTTIQVKRLLAGGWSTVGGGPVAIDATRIADGSSIRSIGGVPFVAWGELNADGLRQLHVAHLVNGLWAPVGGSLNLDPTHDIDDPQLVDVGGVPYVTDNEHTGPPGEGTGSRVDIRRLEPAFSAFSASPTTTGARLSAGVDDLGVPLPVAFHLGTTTFPTISTPGTGAGTVTQAVGGLTPSTSYSWNIVGTDTFRPTAIGPTQSFRTLAPVAHPKPVKLTRLSIRSSRFRVSTKVTFVLSGPGTARFTVLRVTNGYRHGTKCVANKSGRHPRRCLRTTKVGTFTRKATAGSHHFTFSRRFKGQRLAPGGYRLSGVADARTAAKTVAFTILAP